MGVLHRRTGKNCEWRWTQTEQRAFEEVKKLVSSFGPHTRKSLSYAPDSPPIYVICDASYSESKKRPNDVPMLKDWSISQELLIGIK